MSFLSREVQGLRYFAAVFLESQAAVVTLTGVSAIYRTTAR
jgi:hypothetical protein